MNDNIFETIFYTKKFYKKGFISIKSWTADTISIFIKKYRHPKDVMWGIEKEKEAIFFLEECKTNIDPTIDWFPEIIWHNDNIIVFKYVGERLTQFNIPEDYQDQFDKIFSDMVKLNVMHNKIVIDTPEDLDNEFTVLNNKLFLVDYCGHLMKIEEGSFDLTLYDPILNKHHNEKITVDQYKNQIDAYLKSMYNMKKC